MKSLDDIVASISTEEWDFFMSEPNFIAILFSPNSDETENTVKTTEHSKVVVARQFHARCAVHAEIVIIRMNLELIAFYDGMTEDQPDKVEQNISLEKSPMLKENVETHVRTMISCIWAFAFLQHNLSMWHEFKKLNVVDKIARCERKIVGTASSPNLRPILKQILQKNSQLLWKSIVSVVSKGGNSVNVCEDTSNRWLSAIVREKLKQISGSIPSTDHSEIQQKKLVKKELDLVLKTVKKEARKAFKSDEPNNIKNLQNLGNKISMKLLADFPSVINEGGSTTTNSETSKEEQHQQRSENSANTTKYPPYSLDTANDCILALAQIISPRDDDERDHFIHRLSPQIDVRDLGLVFVEKASTEAGTTESDEQKRLEAAEENFLFIAYRQIIYALNQNEKTVDKSYLNGLIESNKRIFVDIILRSKRFEQQLRERNVQNNNVKEFLEILID